MHDQGPRQVPPPDSQAPRRHLPPDAECAKPKQSPVPLRAPCGESFAPWIPDSKLSPLPKNTVNSLIRKILLATPEFPRFYADYILALAPNSNEAKILRPHYQKILAKVNGRRSPCGKRLCRDGRRRPSRSRSDRVARRRNHDCQSCNVRSRRSPTARLQKDSAARGTPTKAAPAFVPFEGWEPGICPRELLQSRPKTASPQAARECEPSSEGAQDYSPHRKAWVTLRKEPTSPEEAKENPAARYTRTAGQPGSCPHMGCGAIPRLHASQTLGRHGRRRPSLHHTIVTRKGVTLADILRL